MVGNRKLQTDNEEVTELHTLTRSPLKAIIIIILLDPRKPGPKNSSIQRFHKLRNLRLYDIRFLSLFIIKSKGI